MVRLGQVRETMTAAIELSADGFLQQINEYECIRDLGSGATAEVSVAGLLRCSVYRRDVHPINPLQQALPVLLFDESFARLLYISQLLFWHANCSVVSCLYACFTHCFVFLSACRSLDDNHAPLFLFFRVAGEALSKGGQADGRGGVGGGEGLQQVAAQPTGQGLCVRTAKKGPEGGLTRPSSGGVTN